jgi:ankyrin repeat protein
LRLIEESKPKPLSREYLELLEGFLTADYLNHRRNLPVKQEGTCEWVFEHSEYLEWRNLKESILWITGNPGMGKTVLVSAIIEKLEQFSTDCNRVLYFFCDDKHEDKRTFHAILRGFIHQLLQTDTVRMIEKYVKPRLFEQKVHGSLATLWDIFISIIADIDGTTTLIVDALDECEEITRGYFFMHFRGWFAKPKIKGCKGSLKIIFTSRPYESIRAEVLVFPSSTLQRLKAESEEELINRDISAYVDIEVDRLAKLRGYDLATKDLVTTTLKSRADGSFLWASLTLRVLAKTPCYKVGSKLKEVPEGLDSVYSSILAGISRDAASMLIWITHALRPLTLADLAVAVDIQHDDPDTATHVVDGMVVERLRADLQLCYPMVKIIRIDGEKDTVHLVHQTAKEFLQTNCDNWGLGPAEANYEIAMGCVTYLRSAHMKRGPVCVPATDSEPGKEPEMVPVRSSFHNKLLPTFREFPFMTYAVLNWAKHVKAAEKYSDKLWKPVLRSLTAGEKTELSCQLYGQLQPSLLRISWYTPGNSACGILVGHGLLSILEHCYRETPDFPLDTPDSRGTTPIMGAAGAGNLSIVHFLQSTGKVTLDNQQESIFDCAIRGGNLEVVQHLLDTGLKPNPAYDKPRHAPIMFAAVDGNLPLLEFFSRIPEYAADRYEFVGFDTPLHTAISLRNIDIMRFLIKTYKEANGWLLARNVNPWSHKKEMSTLSFAVAQGQLPVIECLILEAKMDPNMQDDYGRPALTEACKQELLDIVRFLVSLPNIDVNRTCNDGFTPLISTIRHGSCSTVVEILVGSGKVDIEYKDPKYGRSALIWACVTIRDGDGLIVEHLVLRGKADVHARDVRGRTPLHYAARHQLIREADILQYAGADVEAVDNVGLTPLTVAAKQYNTTKTSDSKAIYLILSKAKKGGPRKRFFGTPVVGGNQA